ncbi:glycoside hydrolase family 88 protein [Pseudarthrobacter sp. NamE5]|uniref:glycoside hydrolase family 88 protein n=1 Tax=Pseudarthrobacter sp. NamE5 TaxID=2576839 RepID=UPI00110A196B|nr:glycoside hydrolase family 88 protein [Pseudarthrobacter sp. NamE5]TLM88259.1 glycosyl hydrolase [Pseudarthrobacter sp. NamE5]
MTAIAASSTAQAGTVLPAMLPLILPTGYGVPAEFRSSAGRAWKTASAKLAGLTAKHPDRFPLYTEAGKWVVDGEAWTNWCEGFLGGQLWMLSRRADASEQGRFRAAAEHYSELIEHRKTDDTVHDLGFLFWSTYRRWFEATGDTTKSDVVVEAGRTTASRYREVGRYMPSFRQPDSLFIDIMMNIHMALYAAQQTGDQDMARKAVNHCLTTRRYLIRGDGSASHEGMFDLQTGAFLKQTTQQGFSDDGSWARGQAWALYGFGTVYRFTGDRRFLQTAVAAADFYIDKTGDRLIPPNDWEEPAPDRPYETSAAAAAAGGMWQLAGLVQDRTKATHYADYAIRILHRLTGEDFLASPEEEWEGVLKHGSYHEGKNLGVDESVMWGDYWFLDAIDQIQQFDETHRSP